MCKCDQLIGFLKDTSLLLARESLLHHVVPCVLQQFCKKAPLLAYNQPAIQLIRYKQEPKLLHFAYRTLLQDSSQHIGRRKLRNVCHFLENPCSVFFWKTPRDPNPRSIPHPPGRLPLSLFSPPPPRPPCHPHQPRATASHCLTPISLPLAQGLG